MSDSTEKIIIFLCIFFFFPGPGIYFVGRFFDWRNLEKGKKFLMADGFVALEQSVDKLPLILEFPPALTPLRGYSFEKSGDIRAFFALSLLRSYDDGGFNIGVFEKSIQSIPEAPSILVSNSRWQTLPMTHAAYLTNGLKRPWLFCSTEGNFPTVAQKAKLIEILRPFDERKTRATFLLQLLNGTRLSLCFIKLPRRPAQYQYYRQKLIEVSELLDGHGS